jgi:hypothetical protein
MTPAMILEACEALFDAAKHDPSIYDDAEMALNHFWAMRVMTPKPKRPDLDRASEDFAYNVYRILYEIRTELPCPLPRL